MLEWRIRPSRPRGLEQRAFSFFFGSERNRNDDELDLTEILTRVSGIGLVIDAN
jgi:hypothetical protein